LGALVESVFGRNVLDGHLFLFVNKRHDRLKAMWWDRDGLVIWYKRLERGGFELPRVGEEQTHVALDATALAMLLCGVPLATPRGSAPSTAPSSLSATIPSRRSCSSGPGFGCGCGSMPSTSARASRSAA
jgi:transposase